MKPENEGSRPGGMLFRCRCGYEYAFDYYIKPTRVMHYRRDAAPQSTGDDEPEPDDRTVALREKILELVPEGGQPVATRDIYVKCNIRRESFFATLGALESEGVLRSRKGPRRSKLWTRVPTAAAGSFPAEAEPESARPVPRQQSRVEPDPNSAAEVFRRLRQPATEEV